MNIIYIHTHDSGRYFEPYGYPVKTPNIQKLALSGTLFRNAFCASPTCSPSRACLLTGTSAHTSGMLGLAHRGFRLKDEKMHLAWFLRNHGFETVLSGVQHEAEDPFSLGYEKVISVPNEKSLIRKMRDLENAKSCARYISAGHEKPFFLSFGMSNTHRPYPDHTEEGIVSDYVRPPVTVEDNDENRKDMADYMAAVQTVDECVGIVTEALLRSGQEENTLILFTTDHGLPWPGMKCTLTDHGTGVALIVAFKNNPLAGRISDALVSQIDIFPTLCELMSLEKPEYLEGKSLVPLFFAGEEPNEYLFSEINYHASYEPVRAVRDRRCKLICRYDADLHPALANMDASPSKEKWISSGYGKTELPEYALYDLVTDPMERMNLYGREEYSAVSERLRHALDEWMKKTNDPLLIYKDRIPAPAGAKITPREMTDPACGIYE